MGGGREGLAGHGPVDAAGEVGDGGGAGSTGTVHGGTVKGGSGGITACRTSRSRRRGGGVALVVVVRA